ncbi:hypothetical protein [Bacillus sp. MMSF_3328]|uniref:hypothetical protein n=1 Tax=Bacillus sp. MMSF_3328 TaxID=3047080 RepID=UPI0035322E13
MDRKYNDLIGDILENAGEKDNFNGKGKPLPKEYLEQDTYQRFQKIAKDAGYSAPMAQAPERNLRNGPCMPLRAGCCCY